MHQIKPWKQKAQHVLHKTTGIKDTTSQKSNLKLCGAGNISRYFNQTNRNRMLHDCYRQTAAQKIGSRKYTYSCKHIKLQCNQNNLFFPLGEFVLVQRTFLPLARLRFSTFRPEVVRIRLRKPCVRASDFLDLDLLVMQRAAFPALICIPRDLRVVILLQLNSIPKDEPDIEHVKSIITMKATITYL